MLQIIHMRAPEPAVIENEAERLDQVDPKPQTGAKPNHGAGILRDVGLV
jgi:hypothetical protein